MVKSSQITTKQHALGNLAVFPAFLKLRERFGSENVFLLESFSDGPSRDARASYIGFGRLLTVRVTELLVEITGCPGLLNLVLAGLDGVNLKSSQRGYFELPLRESLWDLLRAIQQTVVLNVGESGNLEKLGFFGYFGYDVVHAIESLPRSIPSDKPICDVEVSIFQCLVESDALAGSAQLLVHRAPDLWEELELAELVTFLNQRCRHECNTAVLPPLSTRSTTTKERYETGVIQALHHIAIGDIYQVQLGHEVVIQSDVDPLTVYHRLRARNPSPYMYVAPFRSFTLVGASPELYVRSEQDALSMRPIAGTAPRAEDPIENIERIAQLRNNEKEVAEHIMLVDLCRNDLGRICVPRTLTVDELLVVERYSHVYHLVSNVSAERESQHDIYDVIRATFPAGTMTGAPKIRAMEIIEATESTRRGPYAGAIGMIAFNGDANLALCIRTAVYSDGDYWLRASAGIVADSTPESEWNETLHKMAALYWAITDKEIAHESIGY